MKPLLRGAAALLIAIASLPAANVHAQDKQVLASERDKDSYMIGMDVAKSLAPAAEDLDLAAFERAVRNSFDGGEPLIGEKEVLETGQALMVRVEIGGASSRERVCQYVEISVVGVSLKKKKETISQ